MRVLRGAAAGAAVSLVLLLGAAGAAGAQEEPPPEMPDVNLSNPDHILPTGAFDKIQTLIGEGMMIAIVVAIGCLAVGGGMLCASKIATHGRMRESAMGTIGAVLMGVSVVMLAPTTVAGLVSFWTSA